MDAMEERAAIQRWCNGNANAAQTVETFALISQIADDLADAEIPAPVAVERLLLLCLVELPRNPFYMANAQMYAPIMAGVITNWGRSNEWARSQELETRMFAYVLRESAEMLVTVTAFVVGGEDHM